MRRMELALRPLALPYEHGAWGFLFEPIVLALLVAPSVSGVCVAIGIVAAFLIRQPLRLAMRDRMQRKRYPRTRACEAFALGYSVIAAIAFAFAGFAPLLPLVAVLPLAAIQFTLDYRNRGKTLTAELCGALAAGAAATSIVLAASQPLVLGLTLWALLALRAVPSILYVRSVLRGGSRAVMLSAHVVAVLVAALLAIPAAVAMAVLLVRASVPAEGLRARDIGMREVGYGALTVALLAL